MNDTTVLPELRTWLAGGALSVKATYRVDEIARLLDVGRSTVYSMIARGDLPAAPADGPIRIPLASVARLLD